MQGVYILLWVVFPYSFPKMFAQTAPKMQSDQKVLPWHRKASSIIQGSGFPIRDLYEGTDFNLSQDDQTN